MDAQARRGRPRQGDLSTDQRSGDGITRAQRNPSRADVEVARLRARLRRLAAAAGRPLRSRLDEQQHLATRRAGELARMKVVGE
ncbi:hypothetical protein [Parafrankia sp. BMG5.11]|uniref:hypothetical protein n=1 Tax=Parafrankia sp. BMG5.11 TaxID=222540 RepID=UPI0010408CC3|nr:hypothetical protein [Parafrankia sp. BMG5.11]TCJ36876.1 hypothetical protein E0504_21605 [Parafrankia sp. BMG5.11]